MLFSNTRSSSETKVRFSEIGVRSPIVTGHDDFVQNGDGRGSSGSTPLYTSRRCTHGMSLGPPTLQLYFSCSKSKSSIVASANTAHGRTAPKGRSLIVGMRPPRFVRSAPRTNKLGDRACTRTERASRNAEAVGAARASGARDMVPAQLVRGAGDGAENVRYSSSLSRSRVPPDPAKYRPVCRDRCAECFIKRQGTAWTSARRTSRRFTTCSGGARGLSGCDLL